METLTGVVSVLTGEGPPDNAIVGTIYVDTASPAKQPYYRTPDGWKAISNTSTNSTGIATGPLITSDISRDNLNWQKVSASSGTDVVHTYEERPTLFGKGMRAAAEISDHERLWNADAPQLKAEKLLEDTLQELKVACPDCESCEYRRAGMAVNPDVTRATTRITVTLTCKKSDETKPNEIAVRCPNGKLAVRDGHKFVTRETREAPQVFVNPDIPTSAQPDAW